jgi:hypothetical protein
LKKALHVTAIVLFFVYRERKDLPTNRRNKAMNTKELTAQDLMKMMYVVIDGRTGLPVGKPIKGFLKASYAAERKNQTFGGVRYTQKAL